MNPMSETFRKHSQGMTLVELMFTLTLLAILMMLAVPSFNGVLASNRLTSTTNQLYTSFVKAKDQARNLGSTSSSSANSRRITVCASNNGTQCSNDGTAWQNGWITFIDETRTGTVSIDAGETVLAVTQASPDGISISGTNGLDYVAFGASQRSYDLIGGFLASNFRICSTSPALADDVRHRQISVISSGALRVKTPKELQVVADRSVDRTCPNLP